MFSDLLIVAFDISKIEISTFSISETSITIFSTSSDDNLLEYKTVKLSSNFSSSISSEDGLE